MGKLNAEQIAAARARRAAGGPYTRVELPDAPPQHVPSYVERRQPDPLPIAVFDRADAVSQAGIGRISRSSSGIPAGAYVLELEITDR